MDFNLEERAEATPFTAGTDVFAADDQANGQVYNLGAERAESIEEVLNMLLDMSEVEIEVVQEPSRLRPTDVPVVVSDCSKFRERTGWSATVSLRDSLESVLK